jgi:hypothetical protein
LFSVQARNEEQAAILTVIGTSVLRSGDCLSVKSDIGLSVDSDVTVSGPTPSCSVPITVLVTVPVLSYCLLNVRSLSDKCDDVIELRRDHSVDVTCLVETWHDSDSVSIGRLRAQGFVVVDRPRPRLRDGLSINHGGIVVFAASNIQLSILPLASPPSFELLCVRVTSGRTSEVLAVIYRPGSQSVQPQFFEDLHSIRSIYLTINTGRFLSLQYIYSTVELLDFSKLRNRRRVHRLTILSTEAYSNTQHPLYSLSISSLICTLNTINQ